MNWQPFKGYSKTAEKWQPILSRASADPVMFLAGKSSSVAQTEPVSLPLLDCELELAAGTSSSTAPMEHAEPVKPSPVAPMDKFMTDLLTQPFVPEYNGNKDLVRDWELVAPNTTRDVRFDVPEQPDEELEVQDGDYNIVDPVPSASPSPVPSACTVVAQPPSHDIADDGDDGSSVSSHSTWSDPDLMKNGKDAAWKPIFWKS